MNMQSAQSSSHINFGSCLPIRYSNGSIDGYSVPLRLTKKQQTDFYTQALSFVEIPVSRLSMEKDSWTVDLNRNQSKKIFFLPPNRHNTQAQLARQQIENTINTPQARIGLFTDSESYAYLVTGKHLDLVRQITKNKKEEREPSPETTQQYQMISGHEDGIPNERAFFSNVIFAEPGLYRLRSGKYATPINSNQFLVFSKPLATIKPKADEMVQAKAGQIFSHIA